ncbi:hypothetical protein [Mesorhizobium escarrei]|uniref:Trypsin-like peptidase domain-containing protein n=1 Tax=Mesorhizobium escarrei TaxID=666018 RepID=A0ABM9EEZ0_9HYPH|nr:hypothetical protein [Mesorhizobium escarrei]CAH2407918.1 hypothetical protein MES5069_620145 [Mesorhizobium escarrei]
MAIKTIEEFVREHLDEAAKAAPAKFRDAVKPISGVTNKGAPDHIGTAMLLELPEGRFLLTAAHVIDANSETSLYLGADRFKLLQFEALVSAAPDGKRARDHADFAIAPVDPDLLESLSTSKFITEAEISQLLAPTTGRIYTCLGTMDEVSSQGQQYRSHHNDQDAPKIVPPHSSDPPSRRGQGPIP